MKNIYKAILWGTTLELLPWALLYFRMPSGEIATYGFLLFHAPARYAISFVFGESQQLLATSIVQAAIWSAIVFPSYCAFRKAVE